MKKKLIKSSGGKYPFEILNEIKSFDELVLLK